MPLDYDAYVLSKDHICSDNGCEIACEECCDRGCYWEYIRDHDWFKIDINEDLFLCEKCKDKK